MANDLQANENAFLHLPSWQNGSGSPFDTGTSLHVLADTWAHHDFTVFMNPDINVAANHSDLIPDPDYSSIKFPPIGHTKFGHRPDYPYLRIGLAIDAAKTIYNIIPENKSRGCTPVPWSTVISDLETQFGRTGTEYDRAINARAMIHDKFGDSVWYPDHFDPND